MRNQHVGELTCHRGDIAQALVTIAVHARDLVGERADEGQSGAQVSVVTRDDPSDELGRREGAHVIVGALRQPCIDGRAQLGEQGVCGQPELLARGSNGRVAATAVVDAMALEHGGALGVIEHDARDGSSGVEHAANVAPVREGRCRRSRRM